MKAPVSPLTGGNRVELVRRYSALNLQRRWRRRFGIDIAAELAPATEILHWRCLETELGFFHPPSSAGSPTLYAQLARFHWYHDTDRWEFETALPWLGEARNLLEVGCGDGAFLDRLSRELDTTLIGLELNGVTAERARAKGHHILQQAVGCEAVTALGPFDAICSFQVLEHVADPADFLASLVSLLAPGGVLLLGVPNADCFIRHIRTNLLDLPPHHMSRWTAQTLASLGPLLQLETLDIMTETLSEAHAVDYIEAQVQRLMPLPLIPRIPARLLGPALARMPRVRASIQGHSLLGVYRKPGDGQRSAANAV